MLSDWCLLSCVERLGSNLGSNFDSNFERLAKVRGGGCWDDINEAAEVKTGDGMYCGNPDVNGMGEAMEMWQEGDIRGDPAKSGWYLIRTFPKVIKYFLNLYL